jgi:hypothetical protein
MAVGLLLLLILRASGLILDPHIAYLKSGYFFVFLFYTVPSGKHSSSTSNYASVFPFRFNPIQYSLILLVKKYCLQYN